MGSALGAAAGGAAAVKLQVLVVGLCRGSREFLERRLGGVLGELASVRATDPEAALRAPAPDLVAAMAHGQMAEQLREHFRRAGARVLPVELTLLASGVLTLSRLPADSPVGIVCHHRSCANYFLSEIIRSGVVGQRFTSGSFDDMDRMDVGCFVAPEEVALEARKGAGGRRLVAAPRGLSPYSAAELVQVALELSQGRRDKRLASL